jgi:hypothetical protein
LGADVVVEPGAVVGVEDVVDAGLVVGLDVDVRGVVVVVVARFELRTLPGNDFGSAKLPTSIPSVTACMYLCQIVAGNVPPNTTRPWTLFMNRGAAPGALSYPIHTAVV